MTIKKEFIYSSNLERKNIKYIIFFHLFCLTIIFLCSSCRKKNDINCSLMGQNNAVWSESKYLRGYQPTTGEQLTTDQIYKYAINLRNNNIKYIYLFAGPYDSTGHLPRYSFSKTAIFNVEFIKKIYPQVNILPWIGGIQNKTVFLNKEEWVQNALKDTKLLIDTLHVPGVHVDFEYILAGDKYLDESIAPEGKNDKRDYAENVNDFHKKLRVIMPKAFISSVVVATSKDTKPWKRKTTLGELYGLLQSIDQISFLYYDTSISKKKVFAQGCVELLEDINFLKKKFAKVQFLVAYGTFVNVPQLHKYRNLDIENIDHSLKVLRQSIDLVSSNYKIVDGIAIFCDWETDEEEWAEVSEGWSCRCTKYYQ